MPVIACDEQLTPGQVVAGRGRLKAGRAGVIVHPTFLVVREATREEFRAWLVEDDIPNPDANLALCDGRGFYHYYEIQSD